MNPSHISIASLNKENLKDTANTFNYKITHFPSCFKYIQCYLAMVDIIKSKLYFPIHPKKSIKPQKKLPCTTFNYITVTSTLKEVCHDFPVPTVTFNLTNTTHKKYSNSKLLYPQLLLMQFQKTQKIYHATVKDHNMQTKTNYIIITSKLNEVCHDFPVPTVIFNLISTTHKKYSTSKLLYPQSVLMQFQKTQKVYHTIVKDHNMQTKTKSKLKIVIFA